MKNKYWIIGGLVSLVVKELYLFSGISFFRNLYAVFFMIPNQIFDSLVEYFGTYSYTILNIIVYYAVYFLWGALIGLGIFEINRKK